MLTTKLLEKLYRLVCTPKNGLSPDDISTLAYELKELVKANYKEDYSHNKNLDSKYSQESSFDKYDEITLHGNITLYLKDCKNDQETKNLQEAIRAVRHARQCNPCSTFLQSCETYLASHRFLTPKQMAKLFEFKRRRYYYSEPKIRFAKESWMNRDMYGDGYPDDSLDLDIYDVPNC